MRRKVQGEKVTQGILTKIDIVGLMINEDVEGTILDYTKGIFKNFWWVHFISLHVLHVTT